MGVRVGGETGGPRPEWMELTLGFLHCADLIDMRTHHFLSPSYHAYTHHRPATPPITTTTTNPLSPSYHTHPITTNQNNNHHHHHQIAGIWYFTFFKALNFRDALFQIINSLSAVGYGGQSVGGVFFRLSLSVFVFCPNVHWVDFLLGVCASFVSEGVLGPPA